jgi:hypothetical protein
MYSKEIVTDILYRKIKGQEISQDERNTVYEYVLNTTLRAGNGSVQFDAEIQNEFPFEWDKAQTEIMKNLAGSDVPDMQGEELDEEDEN